ncbi:MAG TPA: AbrB/MazE/SpoVT family DNA-binding domain-containing protein [Pyrinomonadaceae bacterium]|jgi:antitoxin MazE|nr:AbrB/MazE/SpoVT family DNA-binding domain-containing protein [Pyrinomonadaceae bacterium]
MIAQLSLALWKIRNYDVIMKAQIIQIGNSQGIRIPKIMLEETRLSAEVELEVHPEGLLIKSLQKPRCTWDAGFKAMAETDDDQPLQTESATRFEAKEWKW